MEKMTPEEVKAQEEFISSLPDLPSERSEWCDHEWINCEGEGSLGWLIDRCSKCGEERA